MTGSLEKKAARQTLRFSHNNSLICPSVEAAAPAAAPRAAEAGEKGVNKQKLYAVLFVVVIENDIISIDVIVIKVKQTKDNKYIYRKVIVTKNFVVEQKHSVKSLINDMLNGNFSRIKLPAIGTIIGLIPGIEEGGNGGNGGNAGWGGKGLPWGGNGQAFVSVPTQDLVGCNIATCGGSCTCSG